ncbi:hypothetical protein BDW02DRAFT_568608 [Decorospora gaudefroyi]|uniref:RING-type domain-containing protein n=1 Tax=Decorospora gaudefroyi TaxID=184978 RepID=A0A6A5KC41_9PLEO|nr:hypothetical protein BDW02DRAFT_568608 [Decorospora gaudefroyi]
MASPAADPKAAPLADDLKELALSLPTTAFPKNFFCALCTQLAFDSYKLICCAKSICSSCQATLQFPTTCPSCDHSPLEADSCTPNKSLRNTMRVWLQKQKKKEEAKAAAQAATPPAEVTPAAPEVQPVGDGAEQPVDSVEEAPKAENGPAEPTAVSTGDAGDTEPRAASASVQPNDNTTSSEITTERRGSTASQNVTRSVAPSTANGATDEQNNTNGPNGSVMGNVPMMNGMQSQMGFGFQTQAAFNNGMAWNGMSNMMSNGNWNGMNPMDFNNMNGMYGNYGGNMGMGMNDMSAMNMMQYGGGYGNGWNGMGGGYGNYSGPNQMGGYNQSGAYPEMMNQFPKNNFPNQNQNRFHASQGGAYPHRNNRNGSYGSFGTGLQNAHPRPGSRSGPSHNRDGQSPNGTTHPAPDAKAEGEQGKASGEPTDEGKESVESAATSADAQAVQKGTGSADASATSDDTNQAGDGAREATQDSGLKPIQTVDTGDAEMENYGQAMMGDGSQANMPYPQGMMNRFPGPAQHMDPSFDATMNMDSGYNGYNRRGTFSSAAYGAATVLTGQDSTEPIGVGVVGAPTGPRAMREGRPNTGFSSRTNSARYPPPPKSVASTHDVAPGSPQRRVRSRSPLRDESMRTRERSPTRSPLRARAREEDKGEQRDRSPSVDRQSRRDDRGRSPTPLLDDDYEGRRDRKYHRPSRYDDHDQDYDGRYRDEKASRGDRTRTASVDSKYRSSRRDKEKHRSSRSHRDRSKEHRRRHRSRSPRADEKYEDNEAYVNGEKDSDGSSRRKHRSGDKDKYRDRSRDRDRERERDRKDRKDRDRDYDYDREKDSSRDKDRDRRRRRDRETEDDERDYDEEKYRSSRRSRKEKERERRDYEERDRERKEKPSIPEKEEDVVGQMMKRRAVSPPLNAPTGPSANGFSIKGRSKNTTMPPPPTGPRAFQPPKGPAADRNKDQRRKSSVSSLPSTPSTSTKETPKEKPTTQDHYAAERERNARERDSRERVDKPPPSLKSRISSKRSRDDVADDDDTELRTDGVPKGPKADVKPPTGPASKRRKSGTTTGDDNIANLFTAGLRKNAKARRGGVRTEGDVEREMERVERERRRR